MTLSATAPGVPMRRLATALLPLAATAACAIPASTVRSLPADAGVEVRYAAPPETVVAALPAVLAKRGFSQIEHSAWDSAATMVFATRPATLFRMGAFMRVLASPDTARTAVVRLATGPAERGSRLPPGLTPRVVQSLDAALGPRALGPFVGDHIRGRDTTADAQLVGGLVMEGHGGALVVARQGRAASPLANFTDVAIARGRYSHRRLGAGLGGLAGLG